MAYDLLDFIYSLDRVGIPREEIAACTLGFGRNGDCNTWEGGFVLHMKSGEPWAFVFGWCDTTGWGCQDDAHVQRYDYEPSEADIRAAWEDALYTAVPLERADSMPTDLNRWICGEIDRYGRPLS